MDAESYSGGALGQCRQACAWICALTVQPGPLWCQGGQSLSHVLLGTLGLLVNGIWLEQAVPALHLPTELDRIGLASFP